MQANSNKKNYRELNLTITVRVILYKVLTTKIMVTLNCFMWFEFRGFSQIITHIVHHDDYRLYRVS